VIYAPAIWKKQASWLQEFWLSLNSGTTRLIEFGRHAAVRRAQRGLGKPGTFIALISGRDF